MCGRDGIVTYVANCLYGLEQLLAGEVAQKFSVDPEHHWCEVVFRFGGPAAELRNLRLAGNVFVRFDEFHIGHTMGALEDLASRVRNLPLARWRSLWRQFQDLQEEEVSVSVDRHGEHNFTYMDVEEAALEALAGADGPKAVLEQRPLELHIDINQARCRLMGRLTARPLSQRPYHRYHCRSETDPSIAAAMVRLSKPGDDDLVLDPFCGTGVIPIERALVAQSGRIVAGENKPKRLSWARGNAELAEAEVTFGCWDSHRLPFADATFDAAITSPPQGDPATGQPWETEQFAHLLAEVSRVVNYNGVMVWLMQGRRPFEPAMERLLISGRTEQVRCDWKGRTWIIYAVKKAL